MPRRTGPTLSAAPGRFADRVRAWPITASSAPGRAASPPARLPGAGARPGLLRAARRRRRHLGPGQPRLADVRLARTSSPRSTMSGFHGFPMPDDYPDYPSRRQIRDYLRSFARDFGLYEHHLGARCHARRARATRLDASRSPPARRAATARSCARPAPPGTRTCPSSRARRVHRRAPATRTTTAQRASSPGKRVLVVGAGNSGVDIACDAAPPPSARRSACGAGTTSSPSTCSARRPTSSPRTARTCRCPSPSAC